MKTKKIVFLVLMYLPLAVSAAAMPFLPDRIPAHYGFDGRVDRFGSRYEALLYPVVAILMGCFMLAMAKLAARQEEHGKNNEKVVTWASIWMLLLFNVLNVYFLYTSFHRVEDLGAVPLDLNRLEFSLLGVLMILLGNIMPKLRRNSVAGLRTRWSMKDETTWKKCQRFGGISFIIGGIVLILACQIAKGLGCAAACLGILLVLVIVDVWYSYKAAQS